MLPEHAPFSPEQRPALDSLLNSLSPGQRLWLGGFLSAGAGAAAAAPSATKAAVPVTFLYGTESGNAEQLADASAKLAKKRGFKPVVRNMAEISPAELEKGGNLLVIVSTWGEGDPPEAAVGFHQDLMTTARDFSKLRFSVCALGDTSYERFCQTGKEVDARLAELGGERISPRQDCDVDFEDAHAAWLDAALEAIGPAAVAATPVVAAVPVAAGYDKKNPFPSELGAKVLLNGEGSTKEIWHYELSLEGSGLDYEPGDALAVVPVNAPDLVEGVLKASKLSGTEEVELKGGARKPLADALREDFDITALSRAVLKKLHAATGSARLEGLLSEESKKDFAAYIDGRWIVDALEDFAPDGLPAAALAGIFRKLPPRLYSIASSPLAHPGEVHLTVASVRYETHGRRRKGVASTYLADLAGEGDRVLVYTHRNKNFRLPGSGDTPIIMVGPGTGIAPFRAFVEHRAEQGAKGGSWLFFGDRNYTYDFLYQLEWQDHLKSGALSRIDLAFSRDQPEKYYVQDAMRARARELYEWLENGAHFYVCGDAARMAGDVHEALLSIVASEGGKSPEEAAAYVDALKKAKRYQRDVY